MGEESGGGSASASDVGGGAGSVAGDLDANADIVVHSSNPGSTSARKRKFSALSQDEISFPVTTSKKKKSSSAITSSFSGQQSLAKSNSKGSTGTRSTSSLAADADADVSLAVAIMGMQASINRLTDVFEKVMATPEDLATTSMAQAVERVRNVDDGLSTKEKEALIRQFGKNAITVDTSVIDRPGSSTGLDSQKAGICVWWGGYVVFL
jgi:hypothetical protein